jgi:hypothetical protein
MNLIPLPPVGLLAPIVLNLYDVKICESGNYPDKFGQIHKHQLIQWVNNFSYIPILLEHHSFTWQFFGYVYDIKCVGESLYATICLTKYGVETLYDYCLRHMGSGWSVGIADNKQSLVELTLCRVPRVSSTHVISLSDIPIDSLSSQPGCKTIDGSNDVGDKIVTMIREIVNLNAIYCLDKMHEKISELVEYMSYNNVNI